MAWLVTLIMLFISGVSHMIKGLDYEETVLALGLAIWLIILRNRFHAASDRPSVWQGIRVLVIALAFTLAYGVAGFYLLERHFNINFGLFTALGQTVVIVYPVL